MFALFKPNIENLIAKQDVYGLLKAMGYKKYSTDHDINEIRKAAEEALISIGDPIVEILFSCLQDDSEIIRENASKVLGKIGESVLERLIVAFADEDGLVCEAAASAIGDIGTQHALDVLLTGLKDPFGFRQQSAKRALMKIGTPAIEPMILMLMINEQGLKSIIEEMLVNIGQPSIPYLVEALKKPDYYALETVARILNRLHWKPENIEDIIFYYLIQNEIYRVVEIGSSIIEPLVAVLRWPGRLVAFRAIFALDKLNWIPGENEDGAWYWVIRESWHKCVEIGSAAVEPLTIAYCNSFSETKRQEIVSALGRIGDIRAKRTLILALKDQDIKVRSKAASELEKLGWEPTDVENRIWYWIAKEQWNECVKIGAAAIEPLVATLKDKDIRLRCAAARALGELGDARAVEILVNLLKGEWKQRKDSAQALATLYHTTNLSKEQKHKILQYRDVIEIPHLDTPSTSCTSHSDSGIGVDFPL